MARELDIPPHIEGRFLAAYSVGLAINLAHAEVRDSGVYADAARRDIREIEERLAVIKAAVAKMPTMSGRAG